MATSDMEGVILTNLVYRRRLPTVWAAIIGDVQNVREVFEGDLDEPLRDARGACDTCAAQPHFFDEAGDRHEGVTLAPRASGSQ